MSYLATEMLLYLAAAAVLGLAMGWLVWGVGGKGRRIKQLTSELGQVDQERAKLNRAVKSEQDAHEKTKTLLDGAKEKMRDAIDAVKAEADEQIVELRQKVDSEREAAQAAYTALERMRGELDDAIQNSQASSKELVDQANALAEAEKANAALALAKEAKSRAELEELRLLIGAEKLAAESARSELDETRRELQTALETERGAHRQATQALDDIRSTLARTFGPAASGIALLSGNGAAPALPAGGDGDPRNPGPAIAGPGGHVTGQLMPPAPAHSLFDASSDIAIAGEALNNPDLDEADSEDREDTSLDLSQAIEADLAVGQAIEVVDGHARPPSGRIELRPLPSEPKKEQATPERPDFLHAECPDRLDDLKAVDGITAEIETLLFDAGVYHYSQLAAMTSAHIAWLAKVLDVPSERIVDERWVEQASALDRKERSDAPQAAD